MDLPEDQDEIINNITNLPKKDVNCHSSSNGPMGRFQDQISSRYSEQIGILQKASQKTASETAEALQKEMIEFTQKKEQIHSAQLAILQSMSTTQVSFDILQKQIEELSQQTIDLVGTLKEKCLSIYSAKFQELSFTVTAVSQTTAGIEKQLPTYLQGKLENEVNRLNQLFLKNKEGFLNVFSQKEQEAKENAQWAMEQFESQTDAWKKNRFAHLVSEAKTQLDLSNHIDYGTLFTDFYKDESKFRVCFHRILRNLTTLIPIEDFTQANLDSWWKDVTNMLETHSNFIKIFTQKIQEKIDERNIKNEELIEKIENEILEMKMETETTGVSEMVILQKQSSKYNSQYLEKIVKYWDNRCQALQKVFETVKDILTPLIQNIQDFHEKINTISQKIASDSEKLREQSLNVLAQLETSLGQKSDEIQILLDEKSINAHVADCKAILSKIEAEYKSYRTKATAVFDDQPRSIETLCAQLETFVLSALKLQKTTVTNDWSSNLNATPESRRNSSRSIKRSTRVTRTRGAKKLKIPVEVPVEVFSICLPNGTKFEESESFTLIQPTEVYVDESLIVPATPKRGRGKPPTPKQKKSPKTPRGRGKGKAEEIEEVDIPEISILDVVQKVDGQPAIEIYVPNNADLETLPHDFQKSIITSLETEFAQAIEDSKHEKDRQKLADELSDRMRTFNPRGIFIEMNIAQSRLIQLKQSHFQIENHFKQAATVFNKSLRNIEKSIEKRHSEIIEKAMILTTFAQELPIQKTVDELTLHSQRFKVSQNHFAAFLEKSLNEQEKEIQEFENNFKSLNDRFLNCLAEGEKEQSNQYFVRMKKHVDQILSELNGKTEATRNEVAQIQKESTEKYESMYPFNLIDVTFSEKLQIIQTEMKSKFDSTLFTNHQSEKMIDITIANVEKARDLDAEPNIFIQRQFETIDDLRIALLKRARYIGILKSRISADPYPVSIDLMKESTETVEKPVTPVDKKKGRTSRATKTRPDSGVKKVSKKSSASSSDEIQSLTGQVDLLEQELNSRVLAIGTEYYNQFKQRKIPITRQALIPLTLNECVDKMKKEWKESITRLNSVLEESGNAFRKQLYLAIKTSQETMSKCIDVSLDFYIQMINEKKELVQQEFDKDLNVSLSKRTEHKQQLGFPLADENRHEELEKLVEEETQRENEEATLISNYRTNVINTEMGVMKLFVTHIPFIVKSILRLFDVFPFQEDLEKAKIEIAERLTTKELIKEKIRKETNAQLDAIRPFRIRQWPQLNTTLTPLQFVVSSEVTPSTSMTFTKRKRRKSEKNIFEKLGESQVEKTPPISSLETSVHRKVIINQNEAFAIYELQLKERLDSLNSYIDSLQMEMNSFTEYWKDCLKAIHYTESTKNSKNEKTKSKHEKKGK